MCNTLHEEGRCTIPARGRGYKLFDQWKVGEKIFLYAINREGRRQYTQGWDGWINWRPYWRPIYGATALSVSSSGMGIRKSLENEGFCFFHTLTEAQRVQQKLGEYKFEIHEIEYSGGLGKCYEERLTCEGCYLSICRAFKPLKRIA